jgi:predicted nuclease with TOPRIM domain
MTPPTIEIDLGKILERIEQNIANFRKETEQNIADFRKETEQNIADFRKEMNQRLTSLEIGQARLEERLTGEIKTVNAKLDGLGKRLDTQEFINRSVVVGLVLAIAAGVVKLFFPNFPGNP